MTESESFSTTNTEASQETVNVADENGTDVTPEQDGGVRKIIIREGAGDDTPQETNLVYVHYTGRLLDGTVFDSSREREEQFSFTLGKGSVIKAWDIGLATMKKGEICKLTCQPQYAYGLEGSPPKIPPNATLVFEIELIDWKLEDLSPKKDEGILRKVITKGELFSTPKEGSTVEVHLLGKFEDKEFDNRDVSFIVGEGSEKDVIEGIEVAIQKFKKGEKSLIFIKSKYAFGATGSEKFNVPPNADVSYEITLKSFEKAKEAWEMDSDEKIEQSEIAKTQGTNYFKESKLRLALKYYKKVVDFLQYEDRLEGENKEKRESLLLAAHLNIALCHLKTSEHLEAVKACDKALQINPQHEKALFRRGQARISLKDFTVAKQDFEKVLETEPDNKAARNQIILCNNKIKEEIEREKKLYRNMFEKLARQDGDTTSSVRMSSDSLNPGVWNEGTGQEEANPNNSQEQKSANSSQPEGVTASS